MARAVDELTLLARKLAALSPQERKKVIKQAEETDWTKHVEPVQVSAEGMARIGKELRRRASPTPAMRRLMSGRKP